MKQERKQLLALVLALLLGVGLLPSAALAEEPEGSISPVTEEAGQIGETEDAIPIVDSGQCGDSVNWRLTENGALVIYGSGDMWDYTVQNAPKWMSDHAKKITRIVVAEGVTSIGKMAFYTGPYPQQIKPEEVLLPGSLRKIGNYAFANSVSGSFTLPEGLQEIGEGAFVNCRITGELHIPGTVRQIGKQAFSSCEELESLVLEEGVQEICEEAFTQCSSLREAHIPASVTAIGYRALGWNLNSLTDVYYGGSIAEWAEITAEEAVMPSARVHCADGNIVSHTAERCGDDLIWSLDENGVLLISGTGDMWDYEVENPPWREKRDQIRELQILPGVTGIGALAFANCSNLERVSIPEGVTGIGRAAFNGCTSLEEILLPESLEQIGGSAFYNCGLIGVIVPDGVTSLGGSAFGSCSKLTCVTIPGSAGCVSASLFHSCKSLSAVNIGEGVETIEYWAFGLCESLRSLRFPSTLRQLGEAPFYSCRNLKQIYFTGPAPSFEEQSFYGVEATAYYPGEDPTWTGEVRQDYGGTISWVPYDVDITGMCGDDLHWVLEEDGTLSLFGTGAMWDGQPWQAYAQQIRRVILPDGLTRIGENAFEGSSALARVWIPASVEQVREDAFSGCLALERVGYGGSREAWPTVQIGSGNEALERAMLYYSASGTCGIAVTWTLSDGVLELRGRGALEKYSLDKRPGWYEERDIIDRVVIENGITEISAYAFCDTAVEQAEIPGSINYIKSYAFSNTKLREIAFPEGTDSTMGLHIAGLAFGSCSALQRISLPKGFIDIADGAFSGCGALMEYLVDPECDCYHAVNGVLFYRETVLADYPAGKPESGYTVPSGVKSIAIGAFDGCRALEHLTIPEGVTSIGSGAFSNCTGLVSVTIPASLEKNRSISFAQCEALTDLYYGDTTEAWQTLSIEYPPHRVTVHCTDGEILTPVTGDVNGDGALDGLDLLRLRKYLVGEQMTIDPLDADLNGDGEVSILDLVRLRKLLAGVIDR